MLNNHVYNLLLQATQKHKSSWRIKNAYKKTLMATKDAEHFGKI